MKRGPKPSKNKPPAKSFMATVPKGVKGRVRAIYLALAEDLAGEGFAAESDWRLVEQAARATAHVERVEAEVSKLEALTVLSQSGEKIHPLVTELRQSRAQLAAMLGQLLLTPRSRSASRLSADMRKPRAAEEPGGDAARVLQLLG